MLYAGGAMLRRGLILFFVLAFSGAAHAQGVLVSGQAIVNSPAFVSGIPGNHLLQAIPGAQITVCASTATGIPCSPLVTIYSNSTLSITAPNPFTADANGNFSFYVTPSTTGYIYSQTAPNTTGQLFPTTPVVSSSSGGNPAGPGNSLQFNNSGAFGGAIGIITPDGKQLQICGPGPWADINCFAPGATAAALTPTDNSTTVICNSGSPTVTLGASNNFVNGAGVTLRNCGPPWNNAAGAQPTCNPPTVTNVDAAGPTRSHITVNTPASATTYNYKLVCRDKYGALTAPSTVGTTTTGQSSLGIQNATVTAASRTNDVITLTVTSNVPIKTMVTVGQTTPIATQFTGDYQVCSNPGTSMTFCGTPLDTRAMPSSNTDQTSWTGTSEIAWFQGNKLTWTQTANTYEVYVCASRPADSGSYHVIGVSDPSNLTTGFNSTSFEDWGATYLSGQVFPDYVTDAICSGAGQNDPLTTTIVSGAPGTSLTLNANASNNSSGTKIVHDDAPIILAAANTVSQSTSPAFAGGTVFLPPIQLNVNRGRQYLINSFLSLPSQIKILEAGGMIVAEPLVMTGNTTWDCGWSEQGSPQFGTNGGCNISVPVAGASIVMQGQANVINNMNLSANENGYTLIIADNLSGELNSVNMSGYQNNADTLGVDLLIRDNTSTIDEVQLNKSTFTGGPNQVSDESWTPLIMNMGAGGNLENWIHFTGNTNWARRGFLDIGSGNCGFVSVDWSYRQGGITPGYSFYNCGQNGGPFEFKDISEDTDGQNRIFNMSGGNPPGASPQGVFQVTSSQGGANPPSQMVSGVRPSFINVIANSNDANGINDEPNRSMNGCGSFLFSVLASPYELAGNAPASEAMCRLREPMMIGGGFALGAELIPPSNLTSAAPTAGGSIPNGTYVWGITALDVRGGETMIPGPITISQTTTTGFNTEPLTWTAVTGAASYNIYRAPTSASCISGGVVNGCVFYRVGAAITTPFFSDTSALTSGTPPSLMTAAASNGMDSNGLWGALFQALKIITVGATPPLAVCGTASGAICFGSGTVPCVPTAGQACIQYDKITDRFLYTLDGSPLAALVGSSGAPIDLPAQSVAILATNINNSVPSTAVYRLCFSAAIVTVGSVSSTLGGANGFQVIYTSPTDSVVKTTVPNAAWSSAANTTGTAVGGCQEVYAKAGTPLQYSFGYTSNAGGTMVYELHIREEDGN